MSKLASKIRDDKSGREAIKRLICNRKNSIEVELSSGEKYQVCSEQHEGLNDEKDN